MKKLPIFISAGILAVVAFVFFLVTRVDYGEAKECANEILATKTAVETFLNMADRDDAAADSFEKAVPTAREALNKLADSSATKDSRVKEDVEQAQAEFAKIEKSEHIWNDVKAVEDLSEESLSRLEKSESKYLSEFAKEYREYLKEFAAYKEKYGAKKDGDLIKEYGEIWNKGEELVQKSKASVEDIMGMSRDDIMAFYAKIEELNKYLATK